MNKKNTFILIPTITIFLTITWLFFKQKRSTVPFKDHNIHGNNIIDNFQAFPLPSYASGDTIYYHNDNSIYADGRILSEADYDTFEVIGLHYAKDKNNIYADWKVLSGVDYSTFKEIDFQHARDKNNIYEYWSIVSFIDAPTFEVLTSIAHKGIVIYARDKNNIYAGREVLSWADYSTFEVINETDAKDKNRTYNIEEIIQNR